MKSSSQKSKTTPPLRVSPRALERLEKSLRKLSRRFSRELKRSQQTFSEKSVHDSRVAARRLLAMLDLLADFVPAKHRAKIADFLKGHLDCFDDLRDTQVQLASISNLQSSYPAAGYFCSWLLKRKKRFSKKARMRIRRLSTKSLSRRIGHIRKRLRKAAVSGQKTAAARRLLKRVDRAFSETVRLRNRIKPAKAPTIHCTRIAFKKFRYMLELLKKDLPPIDENFLLELHHYQTMMGDIQDAEILVQAFDKFLKKNDIEPEFALRLREECLRRRAWLIRVYLDAAGQLREFWPLESTRRAAVHERRPRK